MIIFIVGFFLVLYGLITKKEFSVSVGMACVLLIMGFQEGVPGDYDDYKYFFESFGSQAGYGDTIKDMEYSYRFVIHILPKFMNFHEFVFLSSLLQCIAMGLLVKRYADKRFRYFGVLVLYFTFNIMLLQMKAMRQAYAIDTMIFAYLLLDKRKYVMSLLMVTLAYGFHNSSVVALVAYFVLFIMLFLKDRNDKNKKIENREWNINKKNSNSIALLVAGGLLVFYVLRFKLFTSYINPLFEVIEGFQYGSYFDQLEEEGFVAWWLMLYYVIMTYAVTLYFCTEGDFFKKYLALMVIIGFYMTLLVNGFGNLQRITAYFIIFSIFVFPNTAAVIHKKHGHLFAIAFIAFNLLALMRVTVPYMFSHDFSAGTGFGTYTFSFL